MRGRIDVVQEPRARPHRGPDTQSVILTADEGLEVVVDDGLNECVEILQAPRMKEDRVASEPFGQTRDGGLRAMKRPGDLPMGGAGDQP
jgi:hypothetical protein